MSDSTKKLKIQLIKKAVEKRKQKQTLEQNNCESNVLNTLTSNLQKAIANSGFTNYGLSKKIGRDKDAIKYLLRSRDPKFLIIVDIAKELHLSLDELAGFANKGKQPINKNQPPEETVGSFANASSTILHIDHANLSNKIASLCKQDIDLINTIIDALVKRKIQATEKLLQAISEKSSVEFDSNSERSVKDNRYFDDSFDDFSYDKDEDEAMGDDDDDCDDDYEDDYDDDN